LKLKAKLHIIIGKIPLICTVGIKPTLEVMLPESSNFAFQVKDGTGITENPEETKMPIHSPYPNPPLHQPLNAKDGGK